MIYLSIHIFFIIHTLVYKFLLALWNFISAIFTRLNAFAFYLFSLFLHTIHGIYYFFKINFYNTKKILKFLLLKVMRLLQSLLLISLKIMQIAFAFSIFLLQSIITNIKNIVLYAYSATFYSSANISLFIINTIGFLYLKIIKIQIWILKIFRKKTFTKMLKNLKKYLSQTTKKTKKVNLVFKKLKRGLLNFFTHIYKTIEKYAKKLNYFIKKSAGNSFSFLKYIKNILIALFVKTFLLIKSIMYFIIMLIKEILVTFYTLINKNVWLNFLFFTLSLVKSVFVSVYLELKKLKQKMFLLFELFRAYKVALSKNKKFIFFPLLVLLIIICSLYFTIFEKHRENFIKISKDYSKNPDYTILASLAYNLYERDFFLSFKRYYNETIIVQEGETIGEILMKNNLDYEEAQKIVSAIRKFYSIRNIKKGTIISLYLSYSPKLKKNTFISISLPIGQRKTLVIHRDKNGKFNSYKEDKQLQKYFIKKTFTVNRGFYLSASNKNIPKNIIGNAVKILSWDIDFQREMIAGTKVTILYSCLFNNNGNSIKCNDIKFIQLSNEYRNISIYEYMGNYYNRNGGSTKKSLLRTPVNGSYISSGFGYRRHPILGYNKMHKGIDFAVASGTPIFAAGDGIVLFGGVARGYGNFVIIRHNASLTTAYGHMSRIARRTRYGHRVKQGEVIGYVGQTGKATGPHLHFEVRVAGHHTNPMKVNLPNSFKIEDKDLNKFKTFVSDFDTFLLHLSNNVKISAKSVEKFEPSIEPKEIKEEPKAKKS